jgi:F0F1-type ATP synthase assembly protein I
MTGRRAARAAAGTLAIAVLIVAGVIVAAGISWLILHIAATATP